MEWTEVAVESTTGLGSNCGRSGHNHDKRARIIALQNSVVTKNLTSTTTITSTAATTATFSVTVRQMIKIFKIQNYYNHFSARSHSLYDLWLHIRTASVYCCRYRKIIDGRPNVNESQSSRLLLYLCNFPYFGKNIYTKITEIKQTNITPCEAGPALSQR